MTVAGRREIRTPLPGCPERPLFQPLIFFDFLPRCKASVLYPEPVERVKLQGVKTERRLEERLKGEESILFALLFGSRARGRARQDSDWDVAIYLRPGLSAEKRFRLRLRLLAELDDLGTIDLVVLNDAPPLLGHRALLGKKLFVRDKTTYVRYFVKTIGQSEDERYYREIHERAMLKRLREGRFGRPKKG